MVKEITKVHEDEIDLADTNGNVQKLQNHPPETYANTLLTPRAQYVLIKSASRIDEYGMISKEYIPLYHAVDKINPEFLIRLNRKTNRDAIGGKESKNATNSGMRKKGGADSRANGGRYSTNKSNISLADNSTRTRRKVSALAN